jgi:hypothetical protein
MTTKFRIPIVSEKTTTTTVSGKPVVSTVKVDTVSEPITDHYTTTTINSVGIPTEHSHVTTLYEIPTKKEHTATTIIDGVKTTSEYTTTSYIYPQEKLAYTSSTITHYERTTTDKLGIPHVTESSWSTIEKPEEFRHTFTTFANGPPGTEHTSTSYSNVIPITHQHEKETFSNGVPI